MGWSLPVSNQWRHTGSQAVRNKTPILFDCTPSQSIWGTYTITNPVYSGSSMKTPNWLVRTKQGKLKRLDSPTEPHLECSWPDNMQLQQSWKVDTAQRDPLQAGSTLKDTVKQGEEKSIPNLGRNVTKTPPPSLLTKARFTVLAQICSSKVYCIKNWWTVGAVMSKASTRSRCCSIRSSCFFV